MAILLLVGTAFAGEEGQAAKAPEAKAPEAKAADAKPAAGAAGVGSAIATPVPTAAGAGEKPAAVTATPSAAVPDRIDYHGVDALLRQKEYQYRSGGRDPFAPLVNTGEGAEGEEAVITDPGVADLIMVGRAWGGDRVYALAETPQGMGLLLRVGDRVRDGCVVAISPEGVTFSQTTYGLVRQVTLPFGSVEEGRDER
jgi:hypothetical protein